MSLNQAKPTIINDSFHKKAMKWQSRLKDELAVNRIAKNNQKLDECSFRPNLHLHILNAEKDDRTNHELFKHRWSDETHHHSDVAQKRCEEMYEEGLRKAALVDQIQKEVKRIREEAELKECTFQPTVFKLQQAKKAKEERMRQKELKLKGKSALPGRVSPNISVDTVDTFTRLAFDPRQHSNKSPQKNPVTRWNNGKKKKTAEFEADFLVRQNKFAEIREERLKKTENELDNKLFRPARGKGHWLKSYARSKRMAHQYLEGGEAEKLKLRTPSFWDRPGWARGQSVWGEANARKRGLIDEDKSKGNKNRNRKAPAKMKPPSEAPPPPPPSFAGQTKPKIPKTAPDPSSQTIYQSNLHQKLLEHGVPIPPVNFKMTQDTIDAFLDFCIFVYSTDESNKENPGNGKIALSDILEFFLISQRSFYRYNNHPVADGIENLLCQLSTLIFKGFESGPEEWLNCLKTKGTAVDEMHISEADFSASVNLMLSHTNMTSSAVGQALNEVGISIIVGYLSEVSSVLLRDGDSRIISGLVLIDIVNHYYMEDEQLLKRKEEVEASAANIELGLARRGIDVMRMFSAEDLDRDGALTFEEVRRSLLKIKEVLDVQHDHADLVRAMSGLTTETLDDTADETVEEPENEAEAEAAPKSKHNQLKVSTTRTQRTTSQFFDDSPRGPQSPLASTRSVRALSAAASVVSHRNASGLQPLHMTRREHRQTGLFDKVMGLLNDHSAVIDESKRMFQPVTNHTTYEESESEDESEAESESSPLMSSFMDRLGMDAAEEESPRRKKKKSKKRKARNDKTVDSNIADLSSIQSADGSATSRPKPKNKPKILTTGAHSHEDEFHKLHKERASLKKERMLAMFEAVIPSRVDETMIQEEKEAMGGVVVGNFPQPNNHPTFEEQQQQVHRLARPLPKNKWVEPEPVKRGYENTKGRQRPDPEADPEVLNKYNKKIDKKEIEQWVKRQYDFMLMKKVKDEQLYEENIKEQVEQKFQVSDASLAMCHMKEAEKHDIFDDLYKEGVQYVKERRKDAGTPTTFTVGRSQEGKGIRDTKGDWLALKPISDESMKPSQYSHKPTKHLENAVTVEILSAKKREKNSFMRPLTPPDDIVYPFSPKMNEYSEDIIQRDHSYNYQRKEEWRVQQWVKKTKELRSAEKKVVAKQLTEFTDAVPKTLETSPRKRNIKTIRQIAETMQQDLL
ncbi:hypothetical protein TrVE_jg2366 [Triparma verrucosa]|uniref:EF-hand domain-containing protein n=1 Tax=Triparma verrucosa TaxID=1606542 RepID=A0A9W7EQL6_9STRA|nr:hypothetical protein TrVE_jg2366 [Triparma verrucosa]